MMPQEAVAMRGKSSICALNPHHVKEQGRSDSRHFYAHTCAGTFLPFREDVCVYEHTISEAEWPKQRLRMLKKSKTSTYILATHHQNPPSTLTYEKWLPQGNFGCYLFLLLFLKII